MKMSNGSWVAILIFLTIVFVVSLWMVDVSVSAMSVSADLPGEVKLSNGFWIRNPVQMYHVGLWLTVASFFSTTIVAVKFILGE